MKETAAPRQFARRIRCLPGPNNAILPQERQSKTYMAKTELDLLREVSHRLGDAGIAFMLTGSVSMNYYAQPRMTRDIDLAVAKSAPNA